VSYRVSPEARALPEGIQLTLFRIVQEALTNTLKHAGPSATADVEVVATGADVTASVANTGPQLSPHPAENGGSGLRGMRERASLYSGVVEAGPRPEGGWRVDARRRPPAVAGARRRTRARVSESATTSILLVDDQPMLRMGYRMIFDAQPDLNVVGEAENGLEAIDLTARLEPNVVLMDVRMPDLDGVQATERIVASGSDSKIIVLTTFDLDEYAYGALRAGASGFLLKDAPPPDMLSAIRAVATGDAVVAPSVTRRLLSQFARHLPDPHSSPAVAYERVESLTPRERELLIEVARGLSNAEIAERLVVSEATVKTHVGRILGKLGLRDRVQIVVFAYETGLVRPSG
jgi:DNA-binding NarL/FixJ family response regulator